MNFIFFFLQAEKAQKRDIDFLKVKEAQKQEFDFLQA